MRDGLVGRLSFGAIPAVHSVVPLLTAPLLDSHPKVGPLADALGDPARA